MSGPKKTEPQKPQSSWNPRDVSWTNTRSDDAWKKMMQGGKNLTPRVLPFQEVRKPNR